MAPPEDHSNGRNHVEAVAPPTPAGAPSPLSWLPEGGNALLEAERTLRQRAEDLARTPHAETQAQTEMLVFRLGTEHYAVELSLLRAVHRAKGLTPVPCTPPHVAGVLNVRGEVISVLDLATALDLRAPPPALEQAWVLLSDLPQGRVGLLVSEVVGQRSLALGALARPLSGRDFVWGIAEARIVVLRLGHLFAEGRFEVLEEVT